MQSAVSYFSVFPDFSWVRNKFPKFLVEAETPPAQCDVD